jgi:hypothetical protein
MRWLLAFMIACTSSPNDIVETTPDSGGKADEPTCARETPTVTVGATTKLHQLTGEDDRERGVPAHNRTMSRYGLWGTDLGASFVHGGRTYLLFGDSISDLGGPNPECGDAIATTTDTDPTNGLDLEFLVDGNGHYASPHVPGTRLACYEVPLDGTSAHGRMYVWFSTDTMTRSVLAKSDDDGASFTHVHDLSSTFFVNVSAVRDGDELFLFGSGTYRESEVYLAKVAIDAIEDRAAYRFYAGRSADGCSDVWVTDETEGVPLFGPGCVGELSAHLDPALGAWVVLYNCGEPRGVQARVAHGPTGPWSEQASVFEPWANAGYCHFMHASHEWGTCDQVHDPGRENEWGGEYGPYVVEGISESIGAHAAALYFVLSTWNPYNTMLMRTELTWN